ncbi:hypothetical protein JQ543_30495 [Bradyrhizobium diazoefficiens]|nr:hypothetical protein [Bradyrhizobium diazoefficiens]MBR0852100.1 hypothetical protein [Bradyrhizobium diazoefficiens]
MKREWAFGIVIVVAGLVPVLVLAFSLLFSGSSWGMKTADEARVLAAAYRSQAERNGVSPRAATVLKNIAKSLTALARQYEILESITAEERKHRAN